MFLWWIGWSVLVALCLMIQKVWKCVKSFMVVAIVDFFAAYRLFVGILFNFLCCVRFTGLTMLIYIIWYVLLRPWVGFLEWTLSHDSMLTPWVGSLEWILWYDSLLRPWITFLEWYLALGEIYFFVTVHCFHILCHRSHNTLPPKNSVEGSHQVFKWFHLRICCKVVSKKWVTNQEMSDKSRNE